MYSAWKKCVQHVSVRYQNLWVQLCIVINYQKQFIEHVDNTPLTHITTHVLSQTSTQLKIKAHILYKPSYTHNPQHLLLQLKGIKG